MTRFHRPGRTTLRSRTFLGAASAAALVAMVGVIVSANAISGSGATPSLTRLTTAPAWVPPTLAPGPLVVAGTIYPNPNLHEPVSPTLAPVDLFDNPDQWADSRRPTPVQSPAWLNLKAEGRIALVSGQFGVLGPNWNPLIDPTTSERVPDKKLLDTSYTRWIIEVPGGGRDEKGNYFSNLSYWEFCGNGAMTVALWYWQQLVGHPDVTGTEGYFLDPYAAEAVSWPSPGPEIATRGGTRLGTYWSGSDTVSGFTAHGRGFEFYLAMAAEPPTWQSTGYSLWALDGKPLYPSFGTPPANAVTGLNWEISGHDESADWSESYYAWVDKTDPTLAHDLRQAVMIDVGRDSVPPIVDVDTYLLPNWQAGSSTPHTRHALDIVGYDNTANPPTYTYTETCGTACNRRGGNKDGDIHTISQEQLVRAIQASAGLGFIW